MQKQEKNIKREKTNEKHFVFTGELVRRSQKHTTGKIFKFGIIYFVTETGADPETFRGCPSPSQKIDINK